jgi:hypothetical protein
VRISKHQARLSVLFVVTQIGAWTGCNAILGNGYGVDDLEATDGSPSAEGSVDDGGVLDGTTSADGSLLMDGSVLDGSKSDGSPLPDSGCPNNVCPTMLASAPGAQRLAVSSAAAYWVTATSADRVDLVSGLVTLPLNLTGTISGSQRRGIAVSPSTGIPYVTSPDAIGRGIGKCSLTMSDCSTTFVGSAGFTSSIAIDATSVYVGIYDDGSGLAGGIYQAAPDGSSVVAYLTNEHVLDLQVVGSVTYYRTSAGIRYVTAPSGTPAQAAGLAGDGAIAFVVHQSKLVVVTTNRNIRECTLSSNICTTAAVQLGTAALPTAVAADDNYIYWAEGTTSGSISRCDFPLCGNPTLLADGQATPVDIALDATTIYWANSGGATPSAGAIMKLAK